MHLVVNSAVFLCLYFERLIHKNSSSQYVKKLLIYIHLRFIDLNAESIHVSSIDLI